LEDHDVVQDAEIAANSAGITNNTTNITANASSIVNHSSDIASNAAGVAANAASISSNAADIASNAADITVNSSDILANTSGISANAADIGALELSVSALETLPCLIVIRSSFQDITGSLFVQSVDMTSVLGSAGSDPPSWSGGSPERITVNQDGTYLLGYDADWEDPGSTVVYNMWVRKNGVAPRFAQQTTTMVAGADSWMSGSGLISAVDGDYFELRVRHSDGPNRRIGDTQNVRFYAIRICD
jgi:hypothetical protein